MLIRKQLVLCITWVRNKSSICHSGAFLYPGSKFRLFAAILNPALLVCSVSDGLLLFRTGENAKRALGAWKAHVFWLKFGAKTAASLETVINLFLACNQKLFSLNYASLLGRTVIGKS
jgi:hypothetical protein